ncbi:unnamed protein product [Ectocarpus sp. CCAP 1310/34]|nr:unnamed protein product [Ectocarpus sp. CCAP 1310/34]
MLGKATSFTALVCVAIALLVGTMTPAGAVCSNGLEGIQSTSLDVCCVEGCEVCGGVDCTPANTSSLTSADCCATEIVESGTFCDVSMAAPCIITTAAAANDSVCENGQTGVPDPDTDVCCPLECGDSCGGEGCGSIPGVNATQCCSSLIIESGAVCSDTVSAPCVVGAAEADNSTTCSNGIVGIEDPVNLICCDAACGLCGGPGCGNVTGLTGLDCCSEEIAVVNDLCSVTNEAPCVMDPPDFVASTCPNGLAGVQDGSVCCAEECNGVCGGEGCGSIVGTNGAEDCCSNTILATGVDCEEGVMAPCIMLNGTYTDAPMAAPTFPPAAAPGTTVAPGAVAATEAPVAGTREFRFTQAPTQLLDVNGDGLVNSADTGIVGDTNGDGVVDSLDEGVVISASPTAAPTPAATTAAPTPATTTASPTPGGAADGTRDIGDVTDAPTPSPVRETLSPEDTNGDGVIDSADGIEATPGPSATDDAGATAEGNGAVSIARLSTGGSAFVGVVVAAMAFGGMLL